MELLTWPFCLNQDLDPIDELVEPFLETNLTDYSEENLGIEGLDPRQYTKTPFIHTLYSIKGIYAHLEFLEKNEDIISSPQRQLSNKKFRKGAQIEVNLGSIAKRQLLKKDEHNIQTSSSPFVNEEHYERYVKAPNGGRVISTSDALQSIKAKDEKDEEDELIKARKQLEGAQRQHARLVEDEEKKRKKEEEKAQKEREKLEKAEIRAKEKAEREERKRIEEEVKEARRQELIAQGKKPRGRKCKIDMLNTQDTQ